MIALASRRLRRPRPAGLPPDTAPPIVWAVYLGCHTTTALANEWGIAGRSAYFRLNHARRTGWLKRTHREGRTWYEIRGDRLLTHAASAPSPATTPTKTNLER
jgi:hypothetical protein